MTAFSNLSIHFRIPGVLACKLFVMGGFLIACALVALPGTGHAQSRGGDRVIVPPLETMIPVRSGIDRAFRFRASNLYPPQGFFEPEERHLILLRSKLEQCGTPQCLEDARTLTTKDFGFVPIDLTRNGPGAHAILLPRAGGKACRDDGCYWLVLSGNANRWATIQRYVGFGNYLAVIGEHDRWATLREDEAADGVAHYFVTLRRWQGNYEQAQSRADLAKLISIRAYEPEQFDANLTRQNTGSAGSMGSWQPSAPPQGQSASVRDHWGNVFPINEYLPITNFSGQSDLGKYPELLERRTAEQLRQGDGAVLDQSAKARDGSAPMLRVSQEDSDVLTLESFDRGPDVYQLRIFYRAKPGIAVVGDISPKFADGSGWTVGTLITPAYAPKDRYEWGVGYASVTRYPDGAFGSGSADGSLKSLSVKLGPKDGAGDVFIEKIELWKLGFAEGDPQLVPEVP
ncbi:MAG: hypothetical protein AAGK17_01650 [Pseudomonadota bacterium]